jgi:hypothetical protein
MATTTGSTSSTDNVPSGHGPRRATPLGRAWISIALVPVFFFLSFLVQTGIYALTGHDPSTGDVPPLWANLAAGLPGLAILLVPCVAGVVYGWRAVRSGVRAGMVPAVLAALVGVGAVVLTVANL